MPKISELPAEATPTSDDIVPIVDLGGAVTKKVTLATLAAGIASFFANGAVSGAKITNGTITPDKFSASGQTAVQDSGGSTTSTGYTASLSGTPGTNPSVTVTVGANGLLLVAIGAQSSNTTTNAYTRTSFVLSGANTLAANDRNAAMYQSYTANAEGKPSYTVLLTGLTPGSTTVSLAYRVTAGTGTFGLRTLSVIPL